MEQYANKKAVGGGEGYTVYTCEKNGRFLVIIDQSTLVDLLSEEDSEGISGFKVLEFSSFVERTSYLASKKIFEA